MNINVITTWDYGSTPNITINDECQHTQTRIVEADFGYPDYNLGDYVDDWRSLNECVKCQAYQILGNSEWFED